MKRRTRAIAAGVRGSAVIVFVAILGGCWMPLKMIGGVFQGIGYALPFACAVDVARDILMGSVFGDITIDLCWIPGYTVIFFILGVICLRWRMKE